VTKKNIWSFSNRVVSAYLDFTTKYLEKLSEDKEYYEAPVAHDIAGHVKTLDELIVYLHANFNSINERVVSLGKPGNLDMEALKRGLDAMFPLIQLQEQQLKRPPALQTASLKDQIPKREDYADSGKTHIHADKLTHNDSGSGKEKDKKKKFWQK